MITFQNTKYDHCIKNDGATCDRFIEQECDYAGEVVEHPEIGTITDFNHCSEMCDTFAPYGCTYWVYMKDSYDCYLFDSNSRKCNSTSGPRQPDIDGCPGKHSVVMGFE